jgi:hypothetical protein
MGRSGSLTVHLHAAGMDFGDDPLELRHPLLAVLRPPLRERPARHEKYLFTSVNFESCLLKRNERVTVADSGCMGLSELRSTVQTRRAKAPAAPRMRPAGAWTAGNV